MPITKIPPIDEKSRVNVETTLISVQKRTILIPFRTAQRINQGINCCLGDEQGLTPN